MEVESITNGQWFNGAGLSKDTSVKPKRRESGEVGDHADVWRERCTHGGAREGLEASPLPPHLALCVPSIWLFLTYPFIINGYFSRCSVFLSSDSCPSKLSNPRWGLLGPVMDSQLVRSPGDKLDLQLAPEEVRGQPVKWSPYPGGSNAIFRQIRSEWI